MVGGRCTGLLVRDLFILFVEQLGELPACLIQFAAYEPFPAFPVELNQLLTSMESFDYLLNSFHFFDEIYGNPLLDMRVRPVSVISKGLLSFLAFGYAMLERFYRV